MNTQTPKTTTILLVDDDEIVLNTLSSGLNKTGYNVVPFSSGLESIAYASSSPFDLVVVDYNMPEINGTECIKQIIAHRHVPVIMLSAVNDLHVVRNAIDIGVSTYLVKPVTAENLIPCIEAAMARFVELQAMLNQGTRVQIIMEKNRIINAAVGIIMERLHLPFDIAFERLRKYSRENRTSLDDIAHQIVESTTSVNAIMHKI